MWIIPRNPNYNVLRAPRNNLGLNRKNSLGGESIPTAIATATYEPVRCYDELTFKHCCDISFRIRFWCAVNNLIILTFVLLHAKYWVPFKSRGPEYLQYHVPLLVDISETNHDFFYHFFDNHFKWVPWRKQTRTHGKWHKKLQKNATSAILLSSVI